MTKILAKILRMPFLDFNSLRPKWSVAPFLPSYLQTLIRTLETEDKGLQARIVRLFDIIAEYNYAYHWRATTSLFEDYVKAKALCEELIQGGHLNIRQGAPDINDIEIQFSETGGPALLLANRQERLVFPNAPEGILSALYAQREHQRRFITGVRMALFLS